MGKWDPSKPNAGRSGARWRAGRLAALERDQYVCHWCHHGGAGEADHWPLSIGQLRHQGLDPDDPQHLVASHGTNAPCGTCGCVHNQRRNGRRYQVRLPTPVRTAPTSATATAGWWEGSPGSCPHAGESVEAPGGTFIHDPQCRYNHKIAW